MIGPEQQPVRPRERVTAPEATTSRAEAREGPIDIDIDIGTVYVRSLVRSQLRLAVACAAGFAVLLLGFAASFVLMPDLGSLLVLGVPVSWLMLGFGGYPLVIGIAVIYVRAARRNEAGYLALSGSARRESDGDPT
ncbi:hypothetical protein GCM10007382_28240 [Salinibacterium xinjiangense]|uniref:Uncharacterized protein n=1 Tax=Salinibacterium xinjiangense TaxID=386302 RepID=A0A2C8ZTS3_9MICO|nr:hypothetical protein [Salinibacterium xinjiangense]GGL06640.1 hypothetical protein GCM10007382_28240 [Salinibacterium xinjiangense]SOE68992.1 hypothetical protein SAMN06296378_1883 [Salinibacterium xinjiangense]